MLIGILYRMDHDIVIFNDIRKFIELEHDIVFVDDSEEVAIPDNRAISTLLFNHSYYRQDPKNKTREIKDIDDYESIKDKFKDVLNINNNFFKYYLSAIMYRDIESMAVEETDDYYEIMYKSLLAESGYNYRVNIDYRLLKYIYNHMSIIVLILTSLSVIEFSFGIVYSADWYYNLFKRRSK